MFFSGGVLGGISSSVVLSWRHSVIHFPTSCPAGKENGKLNRKLQDGAFQNIVEFAGPMRMGRSLATMVKVGHSDRSMLRSNEQQTNEK